MKYIEEMVEGDQISGVYFCKNKVDAKTKAGKSYYSVFLQDKTGILDGKVWDLNNGIEHFETNDYIKVDGTVTSFNGTLQLNIKRIRRADEREYDVADYMPVTKNDSDKMYDELTAIVDSIENKYLKELLKSFFANDSEFPNDRQCGSPYGRDKRGRSHNGWDARCTMVQWRSLHLATTRGSGFGIMFA